MDYAPALPAAPAADPEAAPPRASLLALVRGRVRRVLVLEFVELDQIDLGDPAEIDAEVDALFSRGGHRPEA
jgi:hypothetical protein